MSDFSEILSKSFNRLDEELAARNAQDELHANLNSRSEKRDQDKLAETIRLGQAAVSELIALNIPTRQVWARRRVGTSTSIGNTKSGRGKSTYPRYDAVRTAQGWHVLNVFAMDSDGNRPQSPERYGLDTNGNSFRIDNYKPLPEELNGELFAKNDLIAAMTADAKPYFESAQFEYTILDEASQIGVASLIRFRRPYDHLD